MKYSLTRFIRMDDIERRANIGVPDKKRVIYLGFLHHVAETTNPTYSTINTTLLDLTPDNLRGKMIVELLLEDKMLTYDDKGHLSLTAIGEDALSKNIMYTPHEAYYIFTIINDVLVPQHIFNYAPSTPDKAPVDEESSDDSKRWLKEPYYPVYSEGNVSKNTIPRSYSVPGRENENLYLYSICSDGPKLKSSEKCTLTLSIIDNNLPTVELEVKKGIISINSTRVKAWNNFQLYSNLHLNRLGIDYNSESDSLAIEKEFAAMTEEERKSGYANLKSNKEVDVPEYGTFDSLSISDVNIAVSDKSDLIQWALFRMFDSINYYITGIEYQKIRKEASVWCSRHMLADLLLSPTEIEDLLPDYEAMVSYLRHSKQELSEEEEIMQMYINRTLQAKPYRRWYIQAPDQLTFPIGGETE